MSHQLDIPAALQTNPVIAVMRAHDASAYDQVANTLCEEGILSIELTLTTPGTIARFETLRASLPNNVDLGIGTVLTLDQAAQAVDVGVDYIVTPNTDPRIIDFAVKRGVRIYPGGFSPSELYFAWRAKATAVKLFPASTVGASYIGQLRGPFPNMRIIPSGGVDIADAENWIRAGAVAVSVGGPLVGDAFKTQNMKPLRARARELNDRVANARVPK